MSRNRIGVIMGGGSSEREVSLDTGRAVARALELAGRDVVCLCCDRESELTENLRKARIDAAFLALHGRYGEDGCVQGALELLGIPYTGSSVMSSALAMDKLKAKELFRLYNVPTPPYYVLGKAELRELREVHGSFGFPVVVKPRHEGSSVGVTKAHDLGQLAEAACLALRHDDHAIVERFIEAKEVAVGILDGRVLGAIEVAPSSELYDYDAKYKSSTTEYYVPARISETRLLGVLNLAERAASSLECSSAVRVDLLVTEGQNEYVLEVNTLPGMTEQSLLPKIAKAAGYGFADLCVAIADGARLHRAGQTAAPAQKSSAPPTAQPIRLAG